MKCRLAFLTFLFLPMIYCTHLDPSLYSEEEKKDLSETLASVIWNDIETFEGSYDFETMLVSLRKIYEKKMIPKPLDTCYTELCHAQEKKIFCQSDYNLEKADRFFKNPPNQAISIVKNRLIYEVLKEGSGEKTIKQTDIPLFHFTEKTLSGEVLRDTHSAGKPVQIPLSEAILGFSKGVQGMKKGEKRKIYIHPELAYGELSKYEPNQLIVFEVELIEN